MTRTASTRNRAYVVVTALLLVAVIGVIRWGPIQDTVDQVLGTPVQQPTASSSADGQAVDQTFAADYYTVDGAAHLDHEPTSVGVIEYCPLDGQGRTVCAYGQLTSSLRDDAQRRGRQDIDVDPSGWGENGETRIPALAGVEGSTDYSGWMWNRSHLVADSLGGDAVVENLVTGTRTQNVGSHQEKGQYAGGMAYTELIARDYLDTQDGDSCPLYYAASAQYQGDEAIPRTVTVDIRSCDGAIDQHVVVANTANQIDIDYTTGRWSAAG